MDVAMHVAIDAVKELCVKTCKLAMKLEAETRDVMIEKGSFQKFSEYVAEIKSLLQVLQSKGVESTMSSASMRKTLQALDSKLRHACNIIEKNTSGSQIRLLVNCRSMLSQMQQSTNEIAEAVSLLGKANLDITLDLKAKTEMIASKLRSTEFRSATATEAVMLEVERVMRENGSNRDHTIKLLKRIAEAVESRPNALSLQQELEVLRREKEEMEEQKQQAEALQLSQLIKFLDSSETVQSPRNESTEANQQDPINSFKCSLCNDVMEDPVAIDCGHSYERRAIAEHFARGEKTCPSCKQELRTLVLTPNISLRNSIQEWKERNMKTKLQNALSAITSDDPIVLNQALEELQMLMEAPHYRAIATQEELVPKIVESLKTGPNVNAKAALKCLCYLANYSEDNKQAMVREGVIDHIVKQLYRGEAVPDAVAVLLELSESEIFAEKIGNAKDCIPLLVYLLQNPNTNISEKAKKAVQNLSSNTHFVIKMAEAGHLKPFLVRFNQGPLESQASMANALVRIQLNDHTVKVFKDKRFVSSLARALSSTNPAWRSACLMCIKKLSAYPKMGKRFLAESTTMPALLGVICYSSPDPHCKQVAAEILTSLVEASQLADFQTNSNLKELETQHNISLFLQLIIDSVPQTKAQLLHLLQAIGNRSEITRDLVRSDNNAMVHLFSCLNDDKHGVRGQALKLIYCIAKDHPAGIPLPPSPAKEAAINALVVILSSSHDMEERSVAAGIISFLPPDDTTVDAILQKYEALKAIGEVICTVDDWTTRTTPNANVSESLLENALAALLRYTEPTKPELQRQLGALELYPSLVRVLFRGSSLAKQRTAIAMARLSESTVTCIAETTTMATKPQSFMPLQFLTRLSNIPWCCSSDAERCQSLCSLHGSACSSRYTFCLVKADAVKPLIQTLGETGSGAAEAALQALDTLLKDSTALPYAATEIVKSQGVAAILDVLERGPLSAKDKAIDLFQKLFENSEISKPQIRRSKTILIHLLQEDTLKKKVARVLSQMDVIDKQSSFF